MEMYFYLFLLVVGMLMGATEVLLSQGRLEFYHPGSPPFTVAATAYLVLAILTALLLWFVVGVVRRKLGKPEFGGLYTSFLGVVAVYDGWWAGLYLASYFFKIPLPDYLLRPIAWYEDRLFPMAIVVILLMTIARSIIFFGTRKGLEIPEDTEDPWFRPGWFLRVMWGCLVAVTAVGALLDGVTSGLPASVAIILGFGLGAFLFSTCFALFTLTRRAFAAT